MINEIKNQLLAYGDPIIEVIAERNKFDKGLGTVIQIKFDVSNKDIYAAVCLNDDDLHEFDHTSVVHKIYCSTVASALIEKIAEYLKERS